MRHFDFFIMILKYYKKGSEKRFFGIENGKARTTLRITGRWVSNPSIGQLEADGWQETTPPDAEPEPVPSYAEMVVAKIRERYSLNDEIAALRQRDTKPAEFAAYNSYVEQCKAEAREWAETFLEEIKK